MKNDPTKPPLTVLVALGSIAVHADEAISADGHPFDIEAIKTAFHTPGVREWLAAMDKMALLPRKRNP